MNNIKNLLGIAAFLLVVVISCKDAEEKKTEEKKSETYVDLATNALCSADPAWFTIDPTTKKRKTPAPKEDSSSVFGDNTTVTNCDFHRWSWQKFLWLTNDISGAPLFLDSLFQVTNQTVPVPVVDNQIVLSAADKKQATDNVLRTNKSFNSNGISYPVYYSIHVDSSLYKTIHEYAPKDKSEYKDATFPVGALELKIAWVTVDALEDTSSYFVTDGKIEGTNTRVALLGMHVTGIVYNHPEFVWATFEHRDLVPFYDWKSTTTSDLPVTSATNMLLFDVNATATLANITLKSDSTNVFAVNPYGVPRQAKNTFLKTSQAEPKNYDNIAAINSSVQEQLTDVWNNYFYNGSIWIDTEGYDYPTQQARLLVNLGGDLGNSAPGKLPRGSMTASNITMETYEQLGFAPKSIHGQSVTSLANCFSCHSASRGSALTISHIFNGAVDKAKGLEPHETKQKHLDEIQAFIKTLK